MNKNLIIALVVLVAVIGGFVMFSGQSKEEAPVAVSEPVVTEPLVVWINGDKGYNGLQAVGDVFTTDTGVQVKVEWPDDVTEKFQKEAAIGKGPDIFIWAHDRFGDWAKSGLIAPVDPSAAVKSALIDQWGAVTYEGKVYGYPISVEGPTLIYNKALIDTPPSSFDEIIALGGKLGGKTPIVWDYNNTYFSYGVLTSEGGYAFEQTSSGWNGSVTGVNNPGAIAGAAKIRELIEAGVMPEGADYGVMDAAFSQGEAAMVINGPWSWGGYEGSGIDFGLAPYPSVAGGDAKGFIGVLSAAVNASSTKQDLAKEFIENYLLTESGLAKVDGDKPLGVVTHKAFMANLIEEAASSDQTKAERLEAAAAIWSVAEPMPNIPEMSAFWGSMEPALTAISSGRQSAKDALTEAAERIVNPE